MATDDRNKVGKEAFDINTTTLASYPATTTTITQADADKINLMQQILIQIINNANKGA